jgi:signal transduction histidine kinase
LNAVVQDTLRLVSIDATRRGVKLDIEVGAVPWIRGDRIQIEQVLLNLVLNAMDATMDTPRYLRRVCVTTRRVDAQWIELVVSDNGRGLPPEHEKHIFRPFFTTKKGGMGLGLSMSRSIVQAHGGSLQAHTAPDGGAIFTATFPVPEPVDEPELSPELARILT